MSKINSKPEVRFAGFIKDWEEDMLINVSPLQRGFDLPKAKMTTGAFPVVMSNGINGYHNEYKVLGPGVITGRSGTIGNVHYVKSNFWPHNTSLWVTDFKSNYPLFIYIILNKLKLSKFGTGSGVPTLNRNDVHQQKVCLPKHNEQVKISNFFENIDKLILEHQQKQAKLKSLKQAMLDKMFPKQGQVVPEIRFKGFEGDWKTKKLNDISSLITKGTTPIEKSNCGEISFVKIENISSENGSISITSKISLAEHNGYLKRSQLQDGDILFSIAGTLGRVAIISKRILPANTNQALAIIRIINSSVDFVATYLKGKGVKDFVRKNPTVGAQPNLSLEQVGNINIPLPNYNEQIKIGNYFKNLDDLINNQDTQITKLQNTKKAFLAKMFV